VSAWRSLLPMGAGLILLALAVVALLLWRAERAREAAGAARAEARWQQQMARQTRQIAALEAAAAARASAATTAHALTREKLQPIIIHSLEEARTHETTPAGAVLCLDAGRVQSIEASAAALGLEGAAAPGGGAAALHAHPAPDRP
jgi:Sec-independent protein translocase protein TatA